MNIRTPFSRLILLGLILSTNAFSDQSSRYRPMAESLFDMMNAFSSTFQNRMNEQNNDGNQRQSDQSSWLRGVPSWNSGSLPMDMNGLPMSPMMSPWGPGGMNYMPDPRKLAPGNFTPNYNRRPRWSDPGPLDGDWEDSVGSRLSIRNSRFRISQGSNRYSEGYLLMEKSKILSMRTRDSNQKRYYEYAVQGEKLVLRDPSGNLLLFRRMNN